MLCREGADELCHVRRSSREGGAPGIGGTDGGEGATLRRRSSRKRRNSRQRGVEAGGGLTRRNGAVGRRKSSKGKRSRKGRRFWTEEEEYRED